MSIEFLSSYFPTCTTTPPTQPPAGFLVSLDDFYLLGSGLMMTQTTNNMFNASLYALVTPKSLLAWQRVRLAHSLARTGQEWAETFAKHNSGQPPNSPLQPDTPRFTRHMLKPAPCLWLGAFRVHSVHTHAQ